MTKRLVDIDDAKLDAVRRALGTATMKDTVDEALNEVLKLIRRREALLAERFGGEGDLTPSEVRAKAWG